MELTVQKWRRGAAVRLSTELLNILKVNLGDKLTVNIRPDGVLLKAARPVYSLAELVAQCDLSAPEPADLTVWSGAKPVGIETW